MQTITLGRSELEVSRIAFGTWQLGGEWGSVDADEAKAAIRHAIDLGSASSTPPRRTDSEPPNGCSARPFVRNSTATATP